MTVDLFIQPNVITAQRLVLRPLRASDQGLIDMYASDERVARMTTSIPHPLPPGATEAFISRASDVNRTEDVWVMDGSERGLAEVLGVIGLERMDRQQSEISYWVAPAFWNTGFASEALQAIVEANPQGAKTLFGSVFQDNPASARVLTHCGFEYLGDAEAFSVARNAKVATWTYLKKLG
ncbi:GNAT family N-acetyltransferase [Parasulfitobacter algicola]|uniref:GNAT family N-acetyltransferase n=1 Tax=Parasulfitobacter algicola TaxID=2614809 RepID=A0ABX2IQV3_9RHOB|nr:GNAT family N-acetyltransferase [Sulfitobacter algicola]NSX55272.1 GNAT family N-acetyltransferase [Sulfitobacter algicola]